MRKPQSAAYLIFEDLLVPSGAGHKQNQVKDSRNGTNGLIVSFFNSIIERTISA